MKFEWEKIDCGHLSCTERAKVFGGWIVKSREMFDGAAGESVAMVFVPDSEHKWKIL